MAFMVDGGGGSWGSPSVFLKVLGQLMCKCMVSKYQKVHILMIWVYQLTILPPRWLLSWWLGGLVAHFLEALGACHRHFDGLGTVDVKMHGFKVPKSRHFHGFGVLKT